MNAAACGLALLWGLVIGLPVGACLGWLARDRDDRGLAAHNDRLRLKNRALHERNRVLEARDVEMTAFLSIVSMTDWESS